MQSRGIETKKGQSIGPATWGKKLGTFLPPPPQVQLCYCKTWTEIQLSNFGFLSLDSIKTGECRQQMQDLCRQYNFLSYVVLFPKTTALHQSGSLEYLQHSVPLALYRWHEEKVSYNTRIPQKHTRVSTDAVTHCQRGSLMRVKEQKGSYVQKPVGRKGKNNVTLSSLAPQWSWNELVALGIASFSLRNVPRDSETPGKWKLRKTITFFLF